MSWRRALVTAFDTDPATKRYSSLRLQPELVENCLPEEVTQEHRIFLNQIFWLLKKIGKMGVCTVLVVLGFLAVTGKEYTPSCSFPLEQKVVYILNSFRIEF